MQATLYDMDVFVGMNSLGQSPHPRHLLTNPHMSLLSNVVLTDLPPTQGFGTSKKGGKNVNFESIAVVPSQPALNPGSGRNPAFLPRPHGASSSRSAPQVCRGHSGNERMFEISFKI